MADWRDIAVDNFASAVLLFERKRYRSAVSRFYYAVFAGFTHELTTHGPTPPFGAGRQTPAHSELRDKEYIASNFPRMSLARRANFLKTVTDLYRDRISADYADFRIDRQAAQIAYRRAEVSFRYLEIDHERK